MRPTIVISQVLQDLKDGYTRTTSGTGYDPEIGSIEEKYGLNKTQVKKLFQHPQLLKKRTILKKDLGFVIEDDITPVVVEESVNTSMEVSEVESLDGIDANDTNVIRTQIDTIEEVTEERAVVNADPFSFD